MGNFFLSILFLLGLMHDDIYTAGFQLCQHDDILHLLVRLLRGRSRGQYAASGLKHIMR